MEMEDDLTETNSFGPKQSPEISLMEFNHSPRIIPVSPHFWLLVGFHKYYPPIIQYPPGIEHKYWKWTSEYEDIFPFGDEKFPLACQFTKGYYV